MKNMTVKNFTINSPIYKELLWRYVQDTNKLVMTENNLDSTIVKTMLEKLPIKIEKAIAILNSVKRTNAYRLNFLEHREVKGTRLEFGYIVYHSLKECTGLTEYHERIEELAIAIILTANNKVIHRLETKVKETL